jgi:mannose-6-phosphate isomerase-like protein (cupin superfamily)
MDDATFHLDQTVVHLSARRISTAPNDAAYWATRERPELQRGAVLTRFSYTESWDYQERHPTADELAVVLSGRVAVVLGDGQEARSVGLAAGEGCVVPAETWHRLEVDEPCTLLFITPVPARTEHRALADGRSTTTG